MFNTDVCSVHVIRGLFFGCLFPLLLGTAILQEFCFACNAMLLLREGSYRNAVGISHYLLGIKSFTKSEKAISIT